jgi:hypothetical protein
MERKPSLSSSVATTVRIGEMKYWAFASLMAVAPLIEAQQETSSSFEDPMSGANPAASTDQKTKDPLKDKTITNPPVSTEPKQKDTIGEDVAPSPQDPMSASSTAQKVPSSKPNVKMTTKPPLTPELANLNLPTDLTVVDPNPDKTMFLPAGTYRQILQFPIDSPLMQKTQATRDRHGPEIKVENPIEHPLPNTTKPLWIRYESLEKIKIGPDERRGGIDLPVNSPTDLKPRVWYAKSEDADSWSSFFYFVFGGAGYTVANLAGWSAGNTREIPIQFEYRLIRK